VTEFVVGVTFSLREAMHFFPLEYPWIPQIHSTSVCLLGIRKAKMEKKQGCTCESEITSNDLDIVTHWCRASDNEVWPKVPSILRYVNTHKGTSHYLYCIYALVHGDFVAASSLTDKDKKSFISI